MRSAKLIELVAASARKIFNNAQTIEEAERKFEELGHPFRLTSVRMNSSAFGEHGAIPLKGGGYAFCMIHGGGDMILV